MKALALTLVLLLGCKPNPDAGGTRTVEITAAGGTITLGPATLVVPPGALLEPVAITVGSRAAPAPSELRALSPLFDFGPAGLQFEAAATLTIDLAGYQAPAGKRAAIAVLGPQGTLDPLASSTVASGVSASLWHFSGFGAVEAPACDRACTANEACCPTVSGGGTVTSTCVPLGDNLHCETCAPCRAPEICCRDFRSGFPSYQCVDVKTDNPRHCGACNTNCLTGVKGRPHCCAGQCVDKDTDSKNCGTCGTACDPGERCEQRSCVPSPCGDGEVECAGRCCRKGFSCIDNGCCSPCAPGEVQCPGAAPEHPCGYGCCITGSICCPGSTPGSIRCCPAAGKCFNGGCG